MSANAYREPVEVGPPIEDDWLPAPVTVTEHRFYHMGSGQPERLTLSELLKTVDRDARLIFRSKPDCKVSLQLNDRWYEFHTFSHLVSAVMLGLKKGILLEDAIAQTSASRRGPRP